MPKIDVEKAPQRVGTRYPEPFRSRVGAIRRVQLGDAADLTQFGVNLTTIPPGGISALRHWHKNEDELVFVVEGELVLVEDGGKTVLRPGDAAGFKANVPNGHHFANRSDRTATILEIGTRGADEQGFYPDDDLLYIKEAGQVRFTKRDGSDPD
ncbi:MAG: cupin domain-containing protein [Paracoccaceae bacterium]|nr:cupin domain-containing protein [Paracoccaceae bacterium]